MAGGRHRPDLRPAGLTPARTAAVALAATGNPFGRGRLMARVTHVVTIDEVARQIGENLELVEFVGANSDNIDYGEKIWVDNGTEEGITAFTDRGIECLQELLADIRTWNGGILGFLRAEKREPDIIERIMAAEKSR